MRALFARGAFGVDAADSPPPLWSLRRGASRLRAAALRRALVLCARDTRDARARHRNRGRGEIAMKFALVMGLNFGVARCRARHFVRRLGQSCRARLSARQRRFLSRRPSSSAAFFPSSPRSRAGADSSPATLGHSLVGRAWPFATLLLLIAGGCGALAYVLVVLGFRRSLPLGGAQL